MPAPSVTGWRSRREDGLSSDERQELSRLRRDDKQAADRASVRFVLQAPTLDPCIHARSPEPSREPRRTSRTRETTPALSRLFAFGDSDGKRDSAKDVAKSTLRSAGCTDPEALHISDSVIFVHCGLQSQIYAFAKAKPHARLRALEQATTRGITDLDGDAAGTILRVSDGTRVRSISLAQ